jgi:hypothetical protein
MGGCGQDSSTSEQGQSMKAHECGSEVSAFTDRVYFVG